MARKSGKGAKTRPRGENENAYMPGDNKKRKALRARIKSNEGKFEVDPKIQAALKHGIQADKKRANFDKYRQAKKDAKRARREHRAQERKETGGAKLVPKTKENMRRPILGMVDDAADKEIRRDEQTDEFSEFYAQTREKVPEDDDEINEDEELEEDNNKNKNDDDDVAEFDEENVEGLLAEDDDDEDGEDNEEDFEEEPVAVASSKQKEKQQDAAPQQRSTTQPIQEKRMKNPRLLITTCQNPSFKTRQFARECLFLFPNSTYRPRKNYTLTEIITYCTDAKFDFVIAIGERIKQPFEMIITHLPDGPTATFRISTFVPYKEIENVGDRTGHYPELNLKNFDTRLGRRVARILEAMFPATRDYAGRAIATFHNQRDFIFVRTHRYIFDDMDAVRIQELGPRMTLRLMSLQKGTFDSKFGEYEWIRKKKHDSDKLEWYL